MRVKYPFSFESVLTYYKRLYEGKEYPILIHKHSKEKAAEILFAFIKLYESIEFTPVLLMKYGFHYMLPIDFSHHKIPIKEDMKELIIKILQCTDNNGCNNKELIKTFITLFESEYIRDINEGEVTITVYEEFIQSINKKCWNIDKPEKSKMKRIPKFVGAEILYQEYSKVKAMLLTELTTIQSKFFTTKESDITNLISSIKDESLWKDNLNWRVPSFWHITSYYIGKKNAAPDSKYLKKFKEGINIDIDCEVLVYVPERLVMGILYCPELALHQSYKVPSAVWLLNKGNMIFAREMCEQLFEDSKMLYNEYANGFFKTSESFSNKYMIKVGKEQKQCYITKLSTRTTIKAVTKFFYS